MTGAPFLIWPVTFTLLLLIGGAIVIAGAVRRAGPMQKARRQAMAALCAQRGLVPSANLARDFSMLTSIERTGLTNAFATPDGGVAAADLIRSEGKSTAFFSLLSFTVAGVNMPMVSVDPRNVFTAAMVGGPAHAGARV